MRRKIDEQRYSRVVLSAIALVVTVVSLVGAARADQQSTQSEYVISGNVVGLSGDGEVAVLQPTSKRSEWKDLVRTAYCAR